MNRIPIRVLVIISVCLSTCFSLGKAESNGDLSVSGAIIANDLAIIALDCTANTNGGALTTDENGIVVCSNDDGTTGPHTIDTDTQLTEAQVDSYTDNNGYSTGPHTVDTDTHGSDMWTDAAGQVTTPGKVGIGTQSPVSVLDVNGGVRIGNDLSACTSENAGTIRFNAATFQGCNGVEWVEISVSPILVSDHPATCSAVLASNPAAADGVYTIDPDGNEGNDPFDVFCDMSTDGGGWTIIFKSSDPAIWKTNSGTPGTGEWSQDFSGIIFPMNELMLYRVIDAQVVNVTGLSSSDLYQCATGTNDRYWNGTLYNIYSALHLGVHTNETKTTPNGYIIVSQGCVSNKLGWGFGHLAFIDNQQGWGWDSTNLESTVFAIGIR